MVIIKWRRTKLDIVQLQISWDAINTAVSVKSHVGREEDSNRESRMEMNAICAKEQCRVVTLVSIQTVECPKY
jgi:hypothetical protein